MRWLMILSILVSSSAYGASWKIEVQVGGETIHSYDSMSFKDFLLPKSAPGWACVLRKQSDGAHSPIRVLSCIHEESNATVSHAMACSRLMGGIALGVGKITHSIQVYCKSH